MRPSEASREVAQAPPRAPWPGRLPEGETPYYIQLGAYSEEAVARQLEARYGATYPIGITSARTGGKNLYRVVVGPLAEDETGMMLLRFQSFGFPDAFVRTVN